MAKPICKLTSADGSVTLNPVSGTGPCVDLSAGGGGSKAARMVIPLDRTAAQGSGNVDTPAIDDATGAAFTPRTIHAKLHLIGGAASGGGTGDGIMTDGNTIGRQQCLYTRDGTTLAFDNNTIIAAGLSGAIVGYILALAASGAAGTVRVTWTIVNGGATCEGFAIIEGDLP